MAKLGQIHMSLARHRAVQGARAIDRSPVKPRHMRALQEVWRVQGSRGFMLWEAACMFFFRSLRAGEALAPEGGEFDPKAHLTFDDIEVDSLEKPRVVRVRIKESKTDRLR